jgi:hypothetical protein
VVLDMQNAISAANEMNNCIASLAWLITSQGKVYIA